MERRSAIAIRPHKTRCPLLLVADYRFYREMGTKTLKAKKCAQGLKFIQYNLIICIFIGGSSNKSTINYLISLIDRVTKIYEETQWKDKGIYIMHKLRQFHRPPDYKILYIFSQLTILVLMEWDLSLKRQRVL